MMISDFGAPGDEFRARQVGQNTFSSDLFLHVKKPLTAQLGQCWAGITGFPAPLGEEKGLLSELAFPVKACLQVGFCRLRAEAPD